MNHSKQLSFSISEADNLDSFEDLDFNKTEKEVTTFKKMLEIREIELKNKIQSDDSIKNPVFTKNKKLGINPFFDK